MEWIFGDTVNEVVDKSTAARTLLALGHEADTWTAVDGDVFIKSKNVVNVDLVVSLPGEAIIILFIVLV